MVGFKVKGDWKRTFSICPFMKGAEVLIGSGYCSHCKYMVFKKELITEADTMLVYCEGDEHPMTEMLDYTKK